VTAAAVTAIVRDDGFGALSPVGGDVLRLRVLEQPVMRALSAETRLLHSPERRRPGFGETCLTLTSVQSSTFR
jgi:hypothetical protein